jgi:hypothetical protein
MVITLAGFFNSYIKFLPDTDKFPLIIHIHFAAFFCWLTMIVIQPILIRKGKYELHRKIGKLSYWIAPVLVITILMLVYRQTKREMGIAENNAAVTAFIGLLDAISFSVYYSIAMINQRNVRWHVAFLIAATLIILNPGMSRVFNQIKLGLGLLMAVVLPFVVSIIIILFEKIKYKRLVLKSPYFFFFCCWTLEIVLFMTIPSTELWRNLIISLVKPS